MGEGFHGVVQALAKEVAYMFFFSMECPPVGGKQSQIYGLGRTQGGGRCELSSGGHVHGTMRQFILGLEGFDTIRRLLVDVAHFRSMSFHDFVGYYVQCSTLYRH